MKKRIFRDRSRIINTKWYWYRGIPFVIAEAVNIEWEMLNKDKKFMFPSLIKMYNRNGNWYILENPLYWYFGVKLPGEFCFGDSMYLRFEGLPDDLRWEMLKDQAKYDIDNFYNKINIFKYASKFIRELGLGRSRSSSQEKKKTDS